MALIANFPQELIDQPPPPLGPPIEYPFDDVNQNTHVQNLELLQAFVNNFLNADHAVQPLDFTKYPVNALRHHYSVTYNDFRDRRLFFFHHWVAHPEKDCTDMINRSVFPGMIYSRWKKISRRTIYYPGGYGRFVAGYKEIYHLLDLQEGHAEAGARIKLDVYYLRDDQYDNAVDLNPDPEVKKSEWSLVRMYRF
ncbi:hypothetical protein DCAR_0207738 [Daucus carota subsp. sativus]|uniref:Uncharacterized protein n=1 Tax=Daucus carota subsp. sativus TaxID=79200 RepID=A0AAF0WHK8_DAUCS|nr:PREDICTED: uncharacterized protein LOC108206512 [Daucus carota subsp. sativus]XP_017232326.1 PREDICTED: uncharacterized protein LOC108206512 [Daucus carota subsp. sativus]WOG88503.1 hypothetical protein DCAR_0207738 [Daucus carota subsp. sativus]